jgi:CHAT domain-containing protein
MPLARFGERWFLNLGGNLWAEFKRLRTGDLERVRNEPWPQQQGEGVFALSRGFLAAGSRRVVASNWIVDDESSASLVSAFCSALAKQHKSGETMEHADALHQAKRFVRKQDKWQHPY